MNAVSIIETLPIEWTDQTRRNSVFGFAVRMSLKSETI